jgi:hypothetical protein
MCQAWLFRPLTDCSYRHMYIQHEKPECTTYASSTAGRLNLGLHVGGVDAVLRHTTHRC